jgi:hypothetical protein
VFNGADTSLPLLVGDAGDQEVVDGVLEGLVAWLLTGLCIVCCGAGLWLLYRRRRVVGRGQLLLRYQFPVTIFDTVFETWLMIQMLVPSKATPRGPVPVV